MHKYQPRVHLVRKPLSGRHSPIRDLEDEQHKTFVFPETVFIAVTAYQNQLVSKHTTFYMNHAVCTLIMLSMAVSSWWVCQQKIQQSVNKILISTDYHYCAIYNIKTELLLLSVVFASVQWFRPDLVRSAASPYSVFCRWQKWSHYGVCSFLHREWKKYHNYLNNLWKK